MGINTGNGIDPTRLLQAYNQLTGIKSGQGQAVRTAGSNGSVQAPGLNPFQSPVKATSLTGGAMPQFDGKHGQDQLGRGLAYTNDVTGQATMHNGKQGVLRQLGIA